MRYIPALEGIELLTNVGGRKYFRKFSTFCNLIVSNFGSLKHPLNGKGPLMHMREQDLKFDVTEELPLAEMYMVESHLSACGLCNSTLSKATSARAETNGVEHLPKVQERRKESRIETDEVGSVQSIVPFIDDRLDVRILDVSREGMNLHAAKSLDPGMMIKLKLKNVVAFGEVRYCNAAGIGFNIGIKIENVFP
jgi:hypothetical protein